MTDPQTPAPDAEREAREVYEFLREPDGDGDFSLDGFLEWVNRRPSAKAQNVVRAIATLTARAERAEAEPDRARLEERERIAQAIEYEASITPCAEDAAVTRGLATLVRVDFSYGDAEQYEDLNAQLEAELARLRAENAGLREALVTLCDDIETLMDNRSAATREAMARGQTSQIMRLGATLTAARAALSSEQAAAGDGL